MKTLSHDSIEEQRGLSFMGSQSDITIGLMIVKTTTNTGKNQKISRKMKEESVEVFKT